MDYYNNKTRAQRVPVEKPQLIAFFHQAIYWISI
jgi:hypothetical protein